MTEVKTGVCPVCGGSTRKPVSEESQKWIKYNARWNHWSIAGYEPAGTGPFADGCGYEGGTFHCTNCGGQYMSMKPTGQVRLRPDGAPCEHQYKLDPQQSRPTYGWHVYDCVHCGDHYVIDSGD